MLTYAFSFGKLKSSRSSFLSSPKLKAWELFWSPVVHSSVRKLITFSTSPEPLGQFQPNMPQSILEWRVFSNEGPRPFPRGDNCEIVKIHWQNLKMFFSRTTGPISTKLCTKHPWGKLIQVCSNEGQPLLQGEIKIKHQKYTDKFKEIFFTTTTRPFSTKHGA